MAGNVQNYPRIADVYGFSNSGQVAACSRYALVISGPAATSAVAALKAANPAVKAFVYFESGSVDVPGFDGLSIYPPWFMCLAGTTLSSGIDAVTTSIPVANGTPIGTYFATNPDILVDSESMHVTAVNGNTLTVTRGYNSTAAAHGSGAMVRAHATAWSGSWMMNVTPYCPTDGNGRKWTDYLAATAVSQAVSPWDGVFFDSVGSSGWPSLNGGTLDANNDNVADGGLGPSGTGWLDGETALLAAVRAAAAALPIIGNGSDYSQLTGQELEAFPTRQGGAVPALVAYLAGAGPAGVEPFTIVNPDTSDTGTQSLQSMRYNLGIALLGNGYFAYDYGDQAHGQTWWYDEYDNGAGSSLASSMTAAQTTATLVAGTGSKFHVGDVVFAPADWTTYANNDEQMYVSAVVGDTLTVTRGYNGTTGAAHTVPCKVMTAAQVAAGLGWLGQPAGPAYSLTALGASLLANGDFEAAPLSSTWTWEVDTGAGTLAQDGTTAEHGGNSARMTISTLPGSPGDISLWQAGFSLAVTTYTLTFWARASRPGMVVGAGVSLNQSPWTSYAFQTFALTTTWQQYWLTFAMTGSATPCALTFSPARAGVLGSVWLDNVVLGVGDVNLWRRDFDGGVVLVNATAAAQSPGVGAGYRRIAGTQDAVTNSGAAVSAVSIPAGDAVVLVDGLGKGARMGAGFINADGSEVVGESFKSAIINTATTTMVKSGPGRLGYLNILGGTLGAITVYDNTVASGTLLLSQFTPTAGVPICLCLELAFSTGLTIVTAAATVVQVSYS